MLPLPLGSSWLNKGFGYTDCVANVVVKMCFQVLGEQKGGTVTLQEDIEWINGTHQFSAEAHNQDKRKGCCKVMETSGNMASLVKDDWYGWNLGTRWKMSERDGGNQKGRWGPG